jgi:biopolymer transport protein ExbD
MNNMRALALIIFADISFQICNVLCAGYIFVNLKEKEPVMPIVENNILERGIEFPKLAGMSSMVHKNTITAMEILIQQEGGKYIIDGKPVPRPELAANLENSRNESIIVSIDQNAPSGDTLYLFSILNKLNSNVKILHVSEE